MEHYSWTRMCHIPMLIQRLNFSITEFTNHFLKLGSRNYSASEGSESAEEYSPAVQFSQLVMYPATALGRLSSTASSTSLYSSEHLLVFSFWQDFYKKVKFPAPQSSLDRYSGLLLLFSACSNWASPNLGQDSAVLRICLASISRTDCISLCTLFWILQCPFLSGVHL